MREERDRYRVNRREREREREKKREKERKKERKKEKERKGKDINFSNNTTGTPKQKQLTQVKRYNIK